MHKAISLAVTVHFYEENTLSCLPYFESQKKCLSEKQKRHLGG